MKKIIALFTVVVLCLSGISTNAQGLKVYLKDGTTVKYNNEEIDSIVPFESESDFAHYKTAIYNYGLFVGGDSLDVQYSPSLKLYRFVDFIVNGHYLYFKWNGRTDGNQDFYITDSKGVICDAPIPTGFIEPTYGEISMVWQPNMPNGYNASYAKFYLYFEWIVDEGTYGVFADSFYFVEESPSVSLSVTTGDADDITSNSVTLSGKVSGTSSPVDVGFFYGITNTLSVSSGTRVSTRSSSNFTEEISGLTPDTKYYYRAYAYNEGKYTYGDVKSFTTKAIKGTHNGYEWVDLGLPSGTKWATCNVGASRPEDYGGYYAWGETKEKTTYSRENYAHCNIYQQFIDIGSDIAGTKYDVAHVKMGGSWKMPTYEQLMELEYFCNREWTQKNGVNGFLVTGPNGGQIFLPAAGGRMDTLNEKGECGYYWSSSMIPEDEWAYYIIYLSDDMYPWFGRWQGHSVRAVCP